MTKQKARSPLRIWALIGARAGDNDQVVALAEALGLPFKVKQLEYDALCHLGPRLLGRSMASLTASSRADVLEGELPDLTISAGHRSVPIVRALRHFSAGRTRSVHVGFPRISPANFDLVIATPQYPILDHPNLLRIPYALTRAATAPAGAADEALLASLPQPRRLLIVGGPTLFWRLDEGALFGTLDEMIDEAATSGGSVLVTTSPRTPAMFEKMLGQRLADSGASTLLAAPGKPPGYASVLGAADSISVTADSVSMVSDAIWSGKPVALVPVTNSTAGRLYMAAMDRLRPGEPVYPQDLRYFWKMLASIGIGQKFARPRTSTADEMRIILARVKAVLNH